MWLLYSSWNVKLTAEEEAYTTKTVQIINYIKAKSTLRHIYMIQMYVYNSILAGRLGDCWLVPGRLLAGCTGRLLAGCTRKAGWPLERLDGPWEGWVAPGKAAGCAELLIFTDFADFGDFHCCCLVVEAQGWCWFFWMPSRGRGWKLRLICRLPLNLTGNGGLPLWNFKNWPVTQSSQQRVNLKKKPYGNQCSKCKITGFCANSWIFMTKLDHTKGWCVFFLHLPRRWAVP